jgi:glycerol-1-phosphate dehydrogenase [NAD(P)+]
MSEAPARSRKLGVPLQFEIVSGIRETAGLIARAAAPHGDGCARLLVLSGADRTGALAQQLCDEVRAVRPVQITGQSVGVPTLERVERLKESCRAEGPDAIVAIGGGKTIDAAKALAHGVHLPLIVVPTALSSDCIGSPIAVLFDAAGRRVSGASAVPSVVIVDISITVAAPRRLALAGLCDVMSNASALLDAEDAALFGRRGLDGFPAALSEAAYKMLLPLDWSSFHQGEGHARLARALVLSGLAMAFAGSSMPCSGGEHAISHALDRLGNSELHGIQVGVATLFCHHLRCAAGKPGLPGAVVQTLAEARPALTPQLIGVSRAEFLRAVAMGVLVRPERFTILNQVADREIHEAAFDRAFPQRGDGARRARAVEWSIDDGA